MYDSDCFLKISENITWMFPNIKVLYDHHFKRKLKNTSQVNKKGILTSF